MLDVKDKGTDSLDGDRDDIDVMEIEHWDDFEMTYWYIKKNPKKYKTIIIDTITQVQQLAVEKVLEDQNKSTENAGNWGTMRKQDWGTVSSMMKSYITHLRDLKPLVVFLAQERAFNVDEDLDEEDGFVPEIGARLSPATASHLNSEVSVIGNTYIKTEILTEKRKIKNKTTGKTKIKTVEIGERPQYYLRIGPNPLYITKVRKPKGIKLPDSIKDPSYKKIIETLKKTKEIQS